MEQQTPRRQRPRHSLHAMTTALGLAGVLALSGCSLFSGNEDSNAVPTITVTTKASTTPVPLTPAQELAKKVEASLTKLGKTASTPNRDQMKSAMIEAGSNADKLEISQDRTPTGLAVDAIEAATQIDKQCVIGQVRSGRAFVTILPVLDTGFCFVGNQR